MNSRARSLTVMWVFPGRYLFNSMYFGDINYIWWMLSALSLLRIFLIFSSITNAEITTKKTKRKPKKNKKTKNKQKQRWIIVIIMIIIIMIIVITMMTITQHRNSINRLEKNRLREALQVCWCFKSAEFGQAGVEFLFQGKVSVALFA